MIQPPDNPCRVVVMISAGIAAPYIMLDIAAALEKLGHATFLIDLRKLEQMETDDQKLAFFLNIRRELQHFDPHFAVGYNASVFIALHPEGRARHFFEDLGIPYVSLFYDNPMLPQYQKAIYTPDSPLYIIFIWDRHYQRLFQEKHRRDAHYLPLAANTDIFKPLPAENTFAADASFIGSIPENGDFRGTRMACGWHEWLINFAEQIVAAKNQHPDMTVERIIELFQESFPEETRNVFSEFQNQEAYTDFLLSIYAQFGYGYRLGAIQALAGHTVHAYGGNGWQKIDQPGFSAMGSVVYHSQAPQVYNSTKINLNLTGAQLITAVNQRVFDIPACGAFLLSDYRSDLAALFKPGEEIVTFQNIGEMREKVAYYLEHDDERIEIARRARRRVLQEHTYEHRVQKIIGVVRNLS